MVSVYFYDCEEIIKEYINIPLTPEIVVEITHWIANRGTAELWVQIA